MGGVRPIYYDITWGGVRPIYYNITWGGGGSGETPKLYYVIYEQPPTAKTKTFLLETNAMGFQL